MGARATLPTRLNLGAWEHYLGALGERQIVWDFIRFGFPTGYAGPVSDTTGVANHPGAIDYPVHVQEFIDKEIGLDGVIGPFDKPPFSPWCHVSPLMTREKGDSHKRCIITDMTYPQESSINAYIVKNGIYGHEYAHGLPTVDMLATDLARMGPGALLATMDKSRAYTNFMSDPLDWPLLCFSWDNRYYCDLSMPFGVRASSFHMQSVVNAITDTLRAEGIKCYMYLDDLILLSPDRQRADAHYRRAVELLEELGLPEAKEKAQPPATTVKWLGVIINSSDMTLSIPQAKLSQVLEQVKATKAKNFITKRQLQSLLGNLLFIAKCVKPARIFVSRLLTALRETAGQRVYIHTDMRRDLEWFEQFAEAWNGVAVIPSQAPTKVLLVDACLTGIGATDGKFAYGQQLYDAPQEDITITELEAINLVVALHTFLGPGDRGAHVRVRCDNNSTVQVLTTGKARNKRLQECARAAWMVQALLDVEVSYDHIPGKDNKVADVLSRAHLDGRGYG